MIQNYYKFIKNSLLIIDLNVYYQFYFKYVLFK